MICQGSIVIFLVASAILSVISEHRVYYLASIEVDWDYAPSGKSLIHPNSPYSRIYLSSEPDYIGHTYKKVVFREYEDDTFTTMKTHSEYLGFLGPIIEAELGDTIAVHLWNNATQNYSIHPQDLHYSKSSEGSFYGKDHDSAGASGAFVEPGSNFTYHWSVTSGPRDVDPDCVSSLYYSDVNMYKDVNSGLVGFILVCKKGTIGRNTTRKNNHFIFPAVIDENLSWYIENNMALRNVNQTRANDADFKESNRMHSINGFAFGNGPMFNFCIGDNITWHIGTMGENRGVKTIRIHGHSFVVDGHRHDVISVAPGETITAQMLMTELGQWLIRTQSTDNFNNGLESIMKINKCSGKRFTKPVYGKIRRHFVKIEEVVWDYAPDDNLFDSEDKSLTSEGSNSYLYFSKENGRIGGKYKKALYVEYTDSTFKKKKKKANEYGLMGPILGADVGDTLKVVLLNEASRPYSIHPQGVRFDKFNEGCSYNDSNDDRTYDFVEPGKQKTFYWTVPEYLGPMEKDEVCFLRYYTSAVDYVRDFHSGLVGPMLICKKGTFDTQEEKRRFVLMFSIMDENKSWYLWDNIKDFSKPSTYNISSTDFARSNQMHCINGYMYGNLPRLVVFPGKEYKFHVISLGSSTDIHTVYIHGRVINVNGQTFTAYAIPPGTTATLNVNFHSDSDLAYKWALVDRVMHHLSAGISALVIVNPVDDRPAPDSLQERTYYIAAEEIFWDYNQGELPNGCNTSTCYKKAVFRRYHDKEFLRKSNDNDEVGLFGPTILIEGGTKVEIVFKNSASRSYSFHAQGLQVTKENEGASYGDHVEHVKVDPGQLSSYMLRIPETIGPSPNDSGCILYPFYSAVDQERDLNSGLYGVFIVCKKDTVVFDGRNDGVAKSISFILGTIDESRSWYFTPGNNSGSHMYNVINGYSPDVFPGPHFIGKEMYEFRFHSMGDRLHSLHFHGNNFDIFPLGSRQRDRITLYPGTSKTVQVSDPQTGTWQIRGLTYDDVMNDVKIICNFGKGLRAESGLKG